MGRNNKNFTGAKREKVLGNSLKVNKGIHEIKDYGQVFRKRNS